MAKNDLAPSDRDVGRAFLPHDHADPVVHVELHQGGVVYCAHLLAAGRAAQVGGALIVQNGFCTAGLDGERNVRSGANAGVRVGRVDRNDQLVDAVFGNHYAIR